MEKKKLHTHSVRVHYRITKSNSFSKSIRQCMVVTEDPLGVGSFGKSIRRCVVVLCLSESVGPIGLSIVCS